MSIKNPLTKDVFTPNLYANLNYVIRDTIRDDISDSLRTPGKQIIVYGPSKSGKSTLIVYKLKKLNMDFIVTRCLSDNTMTTLILDAFDKLDGFYTSTKSVSKGKSISAQVQSNYYIIKAHLQGTKSFTTTGTEKRIVDVQLTPQRLGDFLGAAKCCWLIEDFHKLNESEKKKLADIMKLYVDMANEHNELKIIATGAVNSAREVVNANTDDLRGRVSELEVPLMSPKEIMQIISNGEKFLNIKMASDIKETIVDFSSGHATICHQLCLNMCFASGIYEKVDHTILLEPELFQEAVENFLKASSDTLKRRIESACFKRRHQKFDNGKLILLSLSNAGSDGLTLSELIINISENIPDYEGKNLRRYCDQLATDKYGGLISYNGDSGKYAFSEPFYHIYVTAHFKKEIPKVTTTPRPKTHTKKVPKINKYDLEEVNRFINDYLISYHETPFENDN